MKEEMKKCSKCKKWLPLDCFHSNKSMKDGKSHYCKVCNRDHISSYYHTESGRKKMMAATAKYLKSAKGKSAQHRYYLKKQKYIL